MEKRTLGRTGLEVSVLGMGGLYVSSAGARGRDEACRAVHRALELGVNYVDTAPSYRDSEEVLGIALEGVQQPYFLATKLGGRPQPFNPQDKDLLRQSVDESLRLLKRDYIDVLLVHEPDRPGQYDWWTDYDRFHGPVCDLLEELKAEKIIRFTGLGGTTAYQLPLIEEVEQNVRAVEAGPLPSDVLAQLQEIADMVPFRPFEEPFGLTFGRPYKGLGQAGR